MHISFEGKLGIWLTVLGSAGAGALEVAPDRAKRTMHMMNCAKALRCS
jgi:hypothetical protein